MNIGPHVYGRNRRGLWVASSSNLTDKLGYFLPRLRNAIPNLTDLFLPPEATADNASRCRENGFFAHTYDVARDRGPAAFAKAALAARKRQGTGALDLNFEGSSITDDGMGAYIVSTLKQLRSTNPNLPVRINVVPFKGKFLPVELINADPQLFVVAQGYGGNMDILYAADEVLDDLVSYGIDKPKTNVMHAVMCSRGAGERQLTLPAVRDKGAFFIDDLLLDAGLLPA